MKQPWKSILTIVLFLAALGVGVGITYKVLSWKDTSGGYYNTFKQLETVGKDRVDVAFVGSSHVYCGLLPATMWENYGISSFLVAISGQDIDSGYHDLVELCKTQSPKVVFVDCYGLLFEEQGFVANMYRNVLALSTSKNYYALVKDVVSEEERQDYLFRFPVVHDRYTNLGKYDFVDYPANAYCLGDCTGYYTEIQNFNWEPMNITESTPANEKHVAWVDELYALSEKEGFELVLMMMPMQMTAVEQMKVNGVREYASSKGISFINVNDNYSSIGLDQNTDFIDYAHLNGYGAEKVSRFFGEYLNTHYELADHRGDADYDRWNKNLTWFYHQKQAAQIRSASKNANSLISQIANATNVVAVISLERGGKDDYELRNLFGALYGLDIYEDETENGGKWMVQNGVVTKVMDNVLGQEPQFFQLSKSDVLSIAYDGDLVGGNIQFCGENYNLHQYNMTVLVYDLITNEVITHVGF